MCSKAFTRFLSRRTINADNGSVALACLGGGRRNMASSVRTFTSYGEATDPLTGLDRPRILITGALGQLGQGLAVLLRGKYGRDNVIMSDIVKPARRLWNECAPYVYIDVLDAQGLEATVVNYQIDWIVHFSAILSAVGEKNVPLALRINIEGLHNVLEVSKQHAVRLFVPSTIGAFGPSSPRHGTPDVTIQRPTTVYGVSKVHAELLGEYLYLTAGLDFRSLRFPGVISATKPGGGTTDYAIKIFYDALTQRKHVCYLTPDTRLPMVHVDDCLRSVVEFMETPKERLTKRTYNLAAISFTPAELTSMIRRYIPDFEVEYDICPVRQAIANSWPESLDDSGARRDWGWKHRYNLQRLTEKMMQDVAADEVVRRERPDSVQVEADQGQRQMTRVNIDGLENPVAA